MGLSSFWTSITGPRVREITPPKKRQAVPERRPNTSSGVRTIRKTPSLDEDEGRELNLVESLLTTNIIEPPPASAAAFEEKKARRRSRGLSLSRSKNEDGLKRRRSLFGGGKEEPKEEEVPDVPTLPTLSAIYSRQAPHQLGDVNRPSTAISAIDSPTWSITPQPGRNSELPAFPGRQPQTPSNDVVEVFELPAELPASTLASNTKASAKAEADLKKSRRRSLGEVLSGKRPKSMAHEPPKSKKPVSEAPVIPAIPVEGSGPAAHKPVDATSTSEVARPRRNSNASVASKATNFSRRRSRRKSWFQRGKRKGQVVAPLPVQPVELDGQAKSATPGLASTQDSSGLGAQGTKPARVDEDAASIRTTHSEKVVARSKPSQPNPQKQRPQSTASHTRRKRRSWWASSNPDDSEDDSNPLPPVPLLIRSATNTPESSPTYSNNGSETGRTPSYIAVRGDDIKAPRPLSTASNRSRTYTPRSAAQGFLVSTTPISDDVRKSVRHSLHGGEIADSGLENDRGTYCLSAEQQREWEKLKHLMAVMDRRRDVTRKTFGEASVTEMFPATPSTTRGVVEKEGVKYSNRDALAALEVGVAK